LIRLIHVSTDLDTGGAEMMLFKLLSRLNRDNFQMEVISLTNIGPIGEKIRALGYTVRAMGMQRGVPNPWGMVKLTRWFARELPDLIQTWMYHADLIGGVAAKIAGHTPVVWGLRQSNFGPEYKKRTTLWTARLCARLSRYLPERIICCSEAVRDVHAKLGYAAEKMLVIPNGFDLEVFKPDPEAWISVRRELGIALDTPLIGLVARFDAQKDHWNFIQAAAQLHAVRPATGFLLCGTDIFPENRQLASWIDGVGLTPVFHLLGPRKDIPRLIAAMDIAVSSSSYGEGFPNVIGEAMACGTPCVVTDVGDSKLIVADTGLSVPARSPRALAEAMQALLDRGMDQRRTLGQVARQRIAEHFSLDAIAAQYEQLYKEITVPDVRTRRLS
jgi:glycosyltransferase involved in cell wall biosynthesis